MIKNKPWRLLVCIVITFVIGSAGLARAQYPERPVHIIVPVAAGGGVDVMARMLAQKLGERLNQTFVVENRAGAAGIIGSKFVSAATPDGYTLLYTPSSLSLSVVAHKNPPYDVTKDFTPIINVAISPYALVVNPSVPAHSLREFIVYAKANPDKLSYSSAGVGSASHLAGEMLKTTAGIEMVHVPNKGMNPALLDVIGGQVQVLFASVPGMLGEKSDRLRPIAMAEKKRSALMPDMPTMDESGLPGFEVANWAGLLGPAGLDPQIVKKLNSEIIAILNTDEMKQRVKTLGYDVIASTPEQFATQLRTDIERWGGVASRAGLSVN
ncbi:MAG TPA: tripartite tricarboxylate transporter substrate binding protein [Pseudolabrys sp.]|nr:tripartite tricarboxylate transporter substrate binding protein [Pseudolabrys sp.]